MLKVKVSRESNMAIEAGPHNIDSKAYIIGPDMGGTVKAMSPEFYQELDSNFNGFKDHVLVMRFCFAEDWPTWEMHPHGDEMVYLLEGDTDFVLWRNGQEEVVRVSEPGSYVCVPRGVWHTARPHTETCMLFITPGEGTLNEAKPR